MSIERQQTGRRGEKIFSLLCTEAGASCNKSTEDDFGWDMLVEFPPKPNPALPYDLQPVHLTASVQVKATKTRTRSCRISLQNALRMAKSPMPSFVFLAAIDSRQEVTCYVVHVWEDLIGEWLKAARTLETVGTKGLNKEYVTLHFTEADDHTSDSVVWIEEQIAAVGTSYSSKKLGIVSSVGFERGYGVANFSLKLENPKDFIDLQLGIKPRLKASRVTVFSERFGIRSIQPEISLEDVELSLQQEGRPVHLRFSLSGERIRVVEAVLLYASGPDGSNVAWRAKAKCFDVVFSAKSFTARSKLEYHAELPVDDLNLFAALQCAEPNALIKIEVDLGTNVVSLGDFTKDEPQSGIRWDVVELATSVISRLCSASAKLQPVMSLSQLNRSAADLNVLGALASDRSMLLKFTPSDNVPSKFRYFLSYAIADVAGRRYAALVRRPVVSDRRHGATRRIYFGPATVLRPYVSSPRELTDEVIHREYKEVLDELGQDSETLALGDLRLHVKNHDPDREICADIPTVGRKSRG